LRLQKELKNTGDIMDRMSEKQLAGVSGATKILAAEWEHFQLRLADPTTLVWVRKLELGLGRLLRTVADGKGPWKSFMRAMVLLLAISGPLLFTLGKFIFIFMMLNKVFRITSLFMKGLKVGMFLFTNPIGLVILAVALLVVGFYLLYTHCAKFRKAINNLLKSPVVKWLEKLTILFLKLGIGFVTYVSIPMLKFFWALIKILYKVSKFLVKLFFKPLIDGFKFVYHLVNKVLSVFMKLFHLKKLVSDKGKAAITIQHKIDKAPIVIKPFMTGIPAQTLTSKLNISVYDPDKHVKSVSASGDNLFDFNLGPNMAMSRI
jgi:hypothetical protein